MSATGLGVMTSFHRSRQILGELWSWNRQVLSKFRTDHFIFVKITRYVIFVRADVQFNLTYTFDLSIIYNFSTKQIQKYFFENSQSNLELEYLDPGLQFLYGDDHK